MKLLVIGSKGFIGGHAIKYFNSKYDVYGADVFKINDANYYQINKSYPDFEQIFKDSKFDVCINASGNGSVPISLNLPVFDFELNVFNTIKILDAIRKHNPECKFVNLSSAAVYGNPKTLPIREVDDLKPLSPYGWHKLYAENIVHEYFYLYNIQTVNLRLFSIYGENLKKQLFWDIFQKSLRGVEIELFGTGEETRDFIYIDDLIPAIDSVINNGLFNGEALNVGSGTETTIQSAAKIFCKSLNKDLKLKFNQLVKPGDPLNWKADISLLRKFGFEPKTNIEIGMKNTALWMKKNI